jgi:hypothetical protein
MSSADESSADPKPKPPKLSPHPLVVGLAATMFGGKPVSDAYSAAEHASKILFEPVARPGQLTTSDEAIKEAVKSFVEARNRWELVKFAGYLADQIEFEKDPEGDGPWQVLFLDETAESYLVMRVQDIKFRDRIKEDKAAFGLLDVVWVKAESRVLTGGRMESLLGRFTTGGFMRAGDFRSSMTGGTFTSASDLGPLCTAFTPCCCNRNSS